MLESASGILLELETVGKVSETMGTDPAGQAKSTFAEVVETAVDLISTQVQIAVSKPISRYVLTGVVGSITEQLHHMVVNTAWISVLNDITDLVIEQVTKPVSEGVGKIFAEKFNYKETISKGIAASMVQRVVEKVLPLSVSIASVGAAKNIGKQLVWDAKERRSKMLIQNSM